MLIVLLVGAAAALVGLTRGGSLEALAETRLRAPWLLVLGLLVQAGSALWSPSGLRGPGTLFVVLLGNLAILVFIARNRTMPGMLLADVGVALNLVVIALNGAMPVSPDAARAAGIERSRAISGFSHEPMTGDTALPWLGDVLPLPYLREVWSPGDVLLAAGIARLIYRRTLSSERDAPPTRGGGRASGSPPEAGRGRPPSPRRHQRARSPRRA